MITNNLFKIRELLFHNIGFRQTVFKNTFWLLLGGGVSTVLKFFLVVYIAKILGATEYGKFTFALAFIGLFAIFSDLGVSKILTREFAKDKKREEDFPAIASLKIFLGTVTLILIFIGSFFVTQDHVIRKLIWVLSLYILMNNSLDTVYAFFRARQRMEYQAGAQIIQTVAITVFGFFVIFNFPTVGNLSLSYLSAALLYSILILIFFHVKVFPLKISFKKSIWRNYLSMAWPMALSGVFGAVYINIDSTMMGYLGQITQTGWYNAAYRITGTAVIPMILISQSFFPVLSKLLTESKDKLQGTWDYYIKVLFFLVTPLVVGGIVLAPKVIDFIYGTGYYPSVLAFQILIIASGIGVLVNPLTQAMLIFNQQKKIFIVVLSGAIVNFILNLIFIPKYSLYGAAFSTVITFLLIFILSFAFTVNFTQIKPVSPKLFSAFWAVIFSSIAMYFIISQPAIYNFHVLWVVALGFLSYSACFSLLKFSGKYFMGKFVL